MQCSSCKEEKPITEFYKRSGSDSHLSECKTCMKGRYKKKTKVDAFTSYVETENLAIRQFALNGIPALPGKSLGVSWCDVLCFGCVGVEVKQSLVFDGGFTFVFTPTQQSRVKGDVIMLICDYGQYNTYHLFDSQFEGFYKNGKLKSGITYKRERSNSGLPVVFTPALMDEAQNRWGLIKTHLERYCKELATTGNPLPRWA